MSEMLEKARKYEDEQGKKIKAEDRPAFHVSPYIGWMNDPNGFSYYQGEYHLFYQYHPYDTHWNSMHWGHVVSKDLLHWEYLPAALAPDEDYDKIGCFSGSAIELEDGRQLLIYTAVDQEKMEDGTVRDIQTQAVAVGDGKNYKKYEWVQYFLNVLFFPWRIHKKFKLKDNIYDNMLTLIISLIMYFIGGFLQLVSLGGVIGIINNIGKLQVTVLLWIGVIVIYCLFFASVIIISAKQFSKEKDSNKIYAVSSIIIALISCIISTVAFVMQFFMWIKYNNNQKQ